MHANPLLESKVPHHTQGHARSTIVAKGIVIVFFKIGGDVTVKSNYVRQRIHPGPLVPCEFHARCNGTRSIIVDVIPGMDTEIGV